MSTTERPGGRDRVAVPRDRDDDYTPEAAQRAPRRSCASRPAPSSSTSAATRSTRRSLPGNIEHFIGVAQVPIGLAGPLLVNGEHAQGEFYVPLATAEGTLVASYNRGMKLLHEAGGVTTTVIDDRMQRAPAFVFDSAREARAFGEWLDEHFDEIKAAAETTTRSGKLQRHRAVLGQPHPLHALQLHDRRRRRPEPDRQGDRGRLRVDRRATTPGIEQLLPGVELRDRQEELAGQHAAHARQAGGRRGDDPRRAGPAASCTRRPS